MKPNLLKTQRLILRKSSSLDALPLFQSYFSNQESARFLTRKPHQDVEQTKKILHKWCDEPWNVEREKFGWVLASRKTNKPIGIFLVEIEDQKAQIHYGIANEFTGQGIIVEAGEAVVQWLANKKILQQIWAVCDTANISSKKVLEKLNFKNEGIFKERLYFPSYGEARDCFYFSISLY